MKFQARAKDGGLIFPSEYQRGEFKKFLKENDGIKFEIQNIAPESINQRKFYHGAIIPLWAFLDGKDYKSSQVLETIHEWAKIEFNGGVMVINDTTHRVAKSTRGCLNSGFIERVTDYLIENYGINPGDVLNPDLYKKFKEEIYPYSNYEDYIEYLIDLKLLRKNHEDSIQN